MSTKISFKRNDTYNVNHSESGIRTFLGRIELNTHKNIKGLGRVNNITSEGGMIDIYQRSLLALLDGRYVFRPAKGITPELLPEDCRLAIADKTAELNTRHERQVREALDECIRVFREIREDLGDE